MSSSDQTRLRQLGQGMPIEDICRNDGWSREEFDSWWQQQLKDRLLVDPNDAGSDELACGSGGTARLRRDAHGIPHISAAQTEDLFFAFGVAMAEDRLFQLDWLRRKASGRLAEIVGCEGLESDRVARTVGLRRIATAEWPRLTAEVQQILTAFSAGINSVISRAGDQLPIEFALLDYTPEEWTPIDSLAIECEFRWYLTGRFPVICLPELARRTLGDGPLYREFLLGEADAESILPRDFYPERQTTTIEPVGSALNDPDSHTGSNNWAVAGRFTASGGPMVASDPHIAFEAVSCWYEARLSGAGYQVAGMAYAGMPAIMFGRNQHVAWSITNNICSLRDLYQERTTADHPDCFEYDGQYEPARTLRETISIRDAAPEELTVTFSRNGPVVDAILPPEARETGPVTLKWLGSYEGGWLTALLAMDRATTAAEFRTALRPWHVPTFCVVFGDVHGDIGLQTTGRIPIRTRLERAFRRGWDPADAWQGLLPFEDMPGGINPERGWLATANHRLADADYPWPLHGCWTSGHRGVRLRQMIEQRLGADSPFDREAFREMQQDSVNLRAAECVPPLVEALDSSPDPRAAAAAAHLRNWDFRVEPDSVAPALFNVFYTHWSRTVAAARFDASQVEFLAKASEGIGSRLLADDPLGWFPGGDRLVQIHAAFTAALDDLTDRFGP
ncbi:MAG: penicillin acylase family protein, partial [Planctomycetaceae bacterium]|nr:penicillin acylase family protein [Planctomycetaceae bacterium]